MRWMRQNPYITIIGKSMMRAIPNILRNFRSIVEAIEHLGGTVFVDKSLIHYEKELDNKNPSTINRNDEELKAYVRETLMAVAFLK